MKRLLLLLALVAGAASAAAQNIAIDPFFVAPGGISTGGGYTLQSIIGEPAAGITMSGGGYTLTSGFLALPTAVQVPGAPTLFIRPAAPGFVTIVWKPATDGYVLQESTGLSPAAWQNSASGAQNPTVVPANQARQYYRLNKP
jgi:hypothetical protein